MALLAPGLPLTMRKILITGANGLLGSYLLKTAKEQDQVRGFYNAHPCPGLSHSLDIKDSRAVDTAFDWNPSVVIHCAGESRVDYAEKNPDEAADLNILGTHNLLAAADSVGCHFVYISSNAVYKGDAPPYTEE